MQKPSKVGQSSVQFNTHLVQAGVDLPTVQRISGHKSLSMVVKYSHQSGTHIQAAMDKLERQYKGNLG